MLSKRRFPPLILLLHLVSPISALTVAARSSLIEATPLVIALQDYYNSSSPPAKFINGLPDLWSNTDVDLDGGAEVHVLHDAPHHPDLRIITTVAEVFYRIVADKRKGILTPADLKGKRIGVVSNSTSEYFAYRYLRDVAGLNESQYTLVSGTGGGLCMALPCRAGSLPDMLRTGEIDALTAFEPTTAISAQTIGEENAVFFRDDELYRELSVLYTTQAKIDDPITRKKIVEFVRALNKVQAVFQNQPEKIWGRVASITDSGASVKTLERIWGLTRWTGGLPSDMVDVLFEENQYVLKDKTLWREAMTRARIASHVYGGVLEEALAG